MLHSVSSIQRNVNVYRFQLQSMIIWKEWSKLHILLRVRSARIEKSVWLWKSFSIRNCIILIRKFVQAFTGGALIDMFTWRQLKVKGVQSCWTYYDSCPWDSVMLLYDQSHNYHPEKAFLKFLIVLFHF